MTYTELVQTLRDKHEKVKEVMDKEEEINKEEDGILNEIRRTFKRLEITTNPERIKKLTETVDELYEKKKACELILFDIYSYQNIEKLPEETPQEILKMIEKYPRLLIEILTDEEDEYLEKYPLATFPKVCLMNPFAYCTDNYSFLAKAVELAVNSVSNSEERKMQSEIRKHRPDELKKEALKKLHVGKVAKFAQELIAAVEEKLDMEAHSFDGITQSQKDGKWGFPKEPENEEEKKADEAATAEEEKLEQEYKTKGKDKK